MTEPSIATAPTSQAAAERRAHETFLSEVSSALHELAHHYCFDVVSTDTVAQPTELIGHQVAGIIGFAGDGFGGTLAIRAPSMVVRGCLPISVVDPHVQQLGDWIAELANQLIGRAKNKMIRYNASFQITPPTYAVADELLVLGCNPTRTSWLAVTTTVGPFVVMVELHTAANFEFRPSDDDSNVAHAEGDMLLF